MEATLDDINSSLNDIKNLLKKLVVVNDIVIPPTSVKLTSTNTTQIFNPNYFYDCVFTLFGTVTSDVVIEVDSVAKGPTNTGQFYLNNTDSGYRLSGIKLNKVLVQNTTALGTGTVYLSFVGSSTSSGTELK